MLQCLKRSAERWEGLLISGARESKRSYRIIDAGQTSMWRSRRMSGRRENPGSYKVSEKKEGLGISCRNAVNVPLSK